MDKNNPPPPATNRVNPRQCTVYSMQTWKWSQCVCLINTRRFIYNMTSLATTICFDTLWRDKHDGVTIIVIYVEPKTLLISSKNFFLINNYIFDLSWLLTTKRWALGEVWWHPSAFLYKLCSFAYLSADDNATPYHTFRKFSKILPLMTSADLNIGLIKNLTEAVS